MKKLKFAKGVVFRKEASGGILFNVDTGDIKVIEDVAFGICDLIDKGATEEQILNQLKKKYPNETTIEKDLASFLHELKNKGVLV